MAVRNYDPYVGPLLESLARQTHAPLELVAYDDASDDRTPELLRSFAASAPFDVRIERAETRRGHVHGFMHAARSCRGDAIAFCDADDVWDERKLERCGHELERSGSMLVLHTARLVDADLRDLEQLWPVIEESHVVPPLGLSGLDVDAPSMAMVFRRELLDVADFDARPPSRYGNGRQMLNDEWVFFVAGIAGSISLLDEPLVLYRQHGANDSGGAAARRERQLTLRPAIGDYRRAAEHTAACADYLTQTSSSDPQLAARLAEGARAYRKAADNWSMRVALYEASDRRSRARLLARLVAGGAYGVRTSGGFGRVALGKDLAAGVALRTRSA
jgi:glycosyltransferase involved in cell wall biosynthesis